MVTEEQEAKVNDPNVGEVPDSSGLAAEASPATAKPKGKKARRKARLQRRRSGKDKAGNKTEETQQVELNNPTVAEASNVTSNVTADTSSEDPKPKGKGDGKPRSRRRNVRKDKTQSRKLDVVEEEIDVMAALDAVPEGNYKVISFAVDLTGSETTDEICQIAAYSKGTKVYSQYVMPTCDVSKEGTKMNGIKVYTMFGKYRGIRNVRTRVVLYTKSLYSTLHEFLNWLKDVKGSSDGIIMIYHDQGRRNVPFYLHKAINAFKMADEYAEVVKGVLNCARIRSERSTGNVTNGEGAFLRTRIQEEGLEGNVKNEELKSRLQSARNRAEYTYKLYAKVVNGGKDAEIVFDDIKKALSTIPAAGVPRHAVSDGNKKVETS